MLNARDKACCSIANYLAGFPRAGLGAGSSGEAGETEDDVLSKFGAKTRKIARSPSTRPPASGLVVSIAEDGSCVPETLSSACHESAVPFPLDPPDDGYHPHVLEYLRTLELQAGVQPPGFGAALSLPTLLSSAAQANMPALSLGASATSGHQHTYVGDATPSHLHHDGTYADISGAYADISVACTIPAAPSASYAQQACVPTSGHSWTSPTRSSDYAQFALDSVSERHYARGVAGFADAYSLLGTYDSADAPDISLATAAAPSARVADDMHTYGHLPGAPDREWMLLLSQVLDAPN
jgi:hypothetical protein